MLTFDRHTSQQYRKFKEKADKMMESTMNGGEKNPLSEDENPFQDSQKIVEDVGINVDENDAAEAARKEEIRQQMIKLEEEIVTLRSALERKEKQHADLKRELGITTWSQLREGIGSQINYIQNTGMVKKTSETLKGWNEKIVQSETYNKTCRTLSDASGATASAFKNAGAATAKKMGELRDSNAFKSIETKVSSATTSIKGKMVRGKSEEMDEGIDETDPNLEKN